MDNSKFITYMFVTIFILVGNIHFGKLLQTISYQHTTVVNYDKKNQEQKTFKDYFQFLNRLYDITWFGAVYA